MFLFAAKIWQTCLCCAELFFLSSSFAFEKTTTSGQKQSDLAVSEPLKLHNFAQISYSACTVTKFTFDFAQPFLRLFSLEGTSPGLILHSHFNGYFHLRELPWVWFCKAVLTVIFTFGNFPGFDFAQPF